MYAIVEASGRQFELEVGRFIDIDLIASEPGETFVFDRVLMLVNGGESHVGQPYIADAKVTCKVLSHIKDRKIIVYKQRPKKGTRKKQGHRQGFTRVLIDTIEMANKVLAKAEHKERPAKEAKPKAEKATKPAKGESQAKAPAAKAAKATKPAKEGAAKKEAKPASTKKAAESKPKAAKAKSE
jgi:large subunit ribosomal protein L21